MVDVAIVGIGCRFPGNVSGPDQLWDFLLARGDGIIEVPPDRWNVDRYYDPDPETAGRMYTRSGGFLQTSLWDFDPEFFGISPREGSTMDPQQRLLLEVAQEAMDDAGVAGRVAGRQVGVYMGADCSDNMLLRTGFMDGRTVDSHSSTASTFTMLSNRISYAYDMRGPSMTIDTACSSSLVALHEAAQSMARGEIELALVGGVNAMLLPEIFTGLCKGRFLAPDGHCKTFDAAADGYARGEGAGVVVLKPLADATRDQDRIYAVVRATGVNQDGRTNGITVPNPEAQADLIRRVTAESGLRPEQIGYVEAHGTGTAVGDPMEMAAIGQTLGSVAGRDVDLVVGSIKNSIGHLEAAAGVASVIKAALTLHRRQLAPQASLNQLNPEIPFAEHRLRVITEAEPFPADYPTAAASVNGFGYGGTNAHAVLVEAPRAAESTEPAARPAPAQVVPISGRNEAGARALARELIPLLQDRADPANPPMDPAALVDAMWSRRSHFSYRFAVPFSGRDDLLSRLAAVADGSVAGGRAVANATAPVFVFSGMGPQWWRMARDLLDANGPFAEAAAELDRAFVDLTGWSVIEELRRDERESRVARTEIAQPANFLVQVGLAAELAHYGVRPGAVVGHSVGEVSAAYVSGALDLRDAVRVSYHRSRLQATTAGSGGLLAVGLSEEEVAEWIAGREDISVSAVNSESGVTLGGSHEAIAELNEVLADEGVFVRRLRVEVPYHSHLMDPILPALRQELAGLVPRKPVVPLYSTVTAAEVTGPDWGAEYWPENVRAPVRFGDAVSALIEAGHQVFLEVGPHPVLSGNIKEILLRKGITGTAVSTLKRNADDADSIRAALADLYVTGALDTDHAPAASRAVPPHRALPVHQFQRQRLWSMEQAAADHHLGTSGALALPGDTADTGQPEWRTELASAQLPWLRDHVVAGLVVLPGTAYVDAALAAAAAVTRRPAPALDDVRFVSPLVVEPTEVPTLRLNVESSSGRFTVSSQSGPSANWTGHATGRIVDGALRPTLSLPEVTTAGATSTTADELYPRLAQRGLVYGPSFRRIVDAQANEDRAVARVDATDTGVAISNHQAHPAVLDAALQCVALLAGAGGGGGAIVPAAVRHVRQFAALTDEVLVGVTRLTPEPGEAELVADVVITGPDGEVLVELHRVQYRPITPPRPMLDELDRLWLEGVFEPRASRDPYGRDDALAGERAFIIAAGAESTRWARDYATHRGTEALLTVGTEHRGDPEQSCAEVQAELQRVLQADGDHARPLVVTLVAVTEAAPAAEPDPMRRAAELPAILAGVARAAQNVQDRALLDGREVTMHGLVITRNALPVPGDAESDLADLAGSALVGARRVLRNEQMLLNWRLIDVDHATSSAAPEKLETVVLESLVTGAYASDDADEVALRDGARLVLVNKSGLAERLAPLDEVRPLADIETNFEMEAPPGRLAELVLREIPRRAPGPGEIELRMDGIGLNFKDPMKVLGVLGDAELAGTWFGTELGMEGMGVVTRIGPGVSGFTVGESRFVSVPGMARRYITVGSDAGAFEPGDGLTLQTCGSVVVFMTAHYALKRAAAVQPGEWVLVAGGAGGVGMAAVQVAAKAGAQVIATASSPERADLLRTLGAKHVIDSRSLTAVEEVAQLTGGHGADVVLNSAPGEAVLALLEAAAEFGRVVEVGKTEIFGGRLIDMGVFNKNLSLISVDMDRMMAHRRDLAREVSREVLALLRSGEYELLPTRIMPVSQLADAFSQVARSTHLGRIVLDFNEPAPPAKRIRPITDIRSDAAYLVTGGLGDFGLATAKWLAGKGAGTIVLAGRSGAARPAQQAAVEALRAGGADVRVEQVDVADRAGVDALLARLTGPLGLPETAGARPLRGVFHAAGVLADEPLGTLSEQGLAAVFTPKVNGALILHEALQAAGTELDHFVLYSSVTSQAGTVSQLSYAAANAVLDGLAHHRARLGLPALSVNWGSLAGGMATTSEQVSQFLALQGVRPLPLDAACEYLDAAIGLDPTQAAIADIDWAVWGSVYPTSAGTPRFAEHVKAAKAADDASGSVRAELASMSPEERAEAVTGMLCEQLAAVLGVPADSVDRDAPLTELGLDSLMAAELRTRVNVALDVQISAMELNRGGGVASLAARLADQLVAAAI
jgi:acyl transferase domain-containing protein/NADPH:quinone reductase-like Zn-dependent oxidoreductase/acyl carrier protein